MKCHIRSADHTFYEGDATMVIAQSPRGEFAIMNDHAPLLATLQPGPLRIQSEGLEQVFACFGGTFRVAEDGGVSILVDDAMPVSEIDSAAISERLDQIALLGEATDPSVAQERERLLVLQRVKERHD